MAGKGGGAWKVAYADFVTAMMAFFMVMWLVAQSKPMKEAIASYFNDPSGKNPRQGNGKSNGMLDKDTPPPPAPRGPLKGTRPSATGRRSRSRRRKRPRDCAASRGDEPARTTTIWSSRPSCSSTRAPPIWTPAVGRSLDRLADDLIGKWSKIEIRGHTSSRPLPPDQQVSRRLATFVCPQHRGDEVSHRQGTGIETISAQRERRQRAGVAGTELWPGGSRWPRRSVRARRNRQQQTAGQ